MRSAHYQPRISSPEQQSSVKPMGSLLNRIFQSPDESTPKLQSRKLVSEKISSTKNGQSFVPFVNERNSMNRLILVNTLK